MFRKDRGSMDARNRGKWEKRLLEERREALDTLGTLDERTREMIDGEDDGELSNYPQHLADEGTDTMEQEKSFLLASQEGRRLMDVSREAASSTRIASTSARISSGPMLLPSDAIASKALKRTSASKGSRCCSAAVSKVGSGSGT